MKKKLLIREQGWNVCFIFLFFYLFVLQTWAIWPFTIDDMYIPLRYAKHWADGYGLLWNVGEPPVEGYSNFSFVFLARMALSVGLNPVVVLKSAGIVGLFFSCLAVFSITRFWFNPRWSLIPCAWLLAYRGQILWSVAGLETTVYQALIAASVFFMIRALGFSWYPHARDACRLSSFIVAGVLLSLAGMTRPEAPAFMVIFFCLLLLNRPSMSCRRYWQGLALYCVTLMICFLPYFLWRFHYYGRLFPNPVYCKGVAKTARFSLDGAYLQLIWPLLLISLIAVWRSSDRRHYFLWVPSVVYLLCLVTADPVVAFDNRLFLPAFVLLLPLVWQGLSILLRYYAKTQETVFGVGMGASAFLLSFFFVPMMSLTGYRYFTKATIAGEQLRQEVATWIQQNARPNTHIVLGDSGLIPYQTEQDFIDSYCLNNARMAAMPSASMYQTMCETVLKTKPDMIILTAALINGQPIYAPADVCLATKLADNRDYAWQVSLETADHDWGYRYEIFSKSNKIAPVIQSSL